MFFRSPADPKPRPAELTEKYGSGISSTDVLSYAMYPAVYDEFKTFTEKYGDLS